jgi:hypothetical protein
LEVERNFPLSTYSLQNYIENRFLQKTPFRVSWTAFLLKDHENVNPVIASRRKWRSNPLAASLHGYRKIASANRRLAMTQLARPGIRPRHCEPPEAAKQSPGGITPRLQKDCFGKQTPRNDKHRPLSISCVMHPLIILPDHPFIKAKGKRQKGDVRIVTSHFQLSTSYLFASCVFSFPGNALGVDNSNLKSQINTYRFISTTRLITNS